MSNSFKLRKSGAKIPAKTVEERLKKGDALINAKNKSQQEYRQLALWMNINDREAYKYCCASSTFGGSYIELFDARHLYETNWAIILQCSSPGRPLHIRHAVMKMVHYGMSLKELNMTPSMLSISPDLPSVKGILKLSNDDIWTLFLHMLKETKTPFTEEMENAVKIDITPILKKQKEWTNYYRERERSQYGRKELGETIADSQDLYEQLVEEEREIQAIMGPINNGDYITIDTEFSPANDESEINIETDSMKEYMKTKFDAFMKEYIPPSGEEMDKLQRDNVVLTTKTNELDAMVLKLLEENEALTKQLATANETLNNVESMINIQLSEARNNLRTRESQ